MGSDPASCPISSSARPKQQRLQAPCCSSLQMKHQCRKKFMRVQRAMQSHGGGHSQPSEAPIMLPCCICGTYSKGVGNKRFYRYAEPNCTDTKGSGTETEDIAGSSAAPADSESSLDFGSSSDSDGGRGSPLELLDDGGIYGMGDAPMQPDDAADGSVVDIQAAALVSQPPPLPSGVRKRAAAALQPRAICSRCRLNPRPASSATEDLIGRHSSWGNVSPFYFDLDSASAALAHAPALQQLPPEIALTAGLVVRTPGRPQQTSISSRVMACALGQSMGNASPTRPSFKSFLVRRLTFAAWSALTHCDWASAEALARALQPARMMVADVLWKTGLEVLRRNPAKDSQRRRFAQMCIGFTQGPLNTAVLNQHVIDTVQYSADADTALAELRRFTVGSTIAASPVLHYSIACAGLAVAATAAAEDGYESLRVSAAHHTALDAAVRLLEVAPASVQSHVTMWHVLNSCGRSAEAAAVVEAALAATSPLHMHPSLLHIAVSDSSISRDVAMSSAFYLMELDPCHPAPAAYIAAAAASGRLKLPAAGEALAAALDTRTPLQAQTWEIVTLHLGQLMWGWELQRVNDWLGWRYVWWQRLHLSNAHQQISAAVSPEAQSIVACKALLALLLQGPGSSFRGDFLRSCSTWAAAVWLHQAELLCSDTGTTGSLSAQESPAASLVTGCEGGEGEFEDVSSSAAAASESSSAAVSHTMSVSMR